MSKPFVPKVGTTAECAAFTGLKNEVVIDEEKGSLIVHDGVTAGGAHEILPKAKNDELYAPKGLDVGVTSFNGSKGAVTYSAPVSSVNGKTGAVTVDVGVTSVNGQTGSVTVGTVRSVNGTTADANGNVTISFPSPKAYVTETYRSGSTWYRKWSDGFIEQGGVVVSKPSATVTFLVAFSSAVLCVRVNGYSATSNNPEQLKLDGKPSLTAFWTKAVYGTSNAQGTTNIEGYWDACGY